MNIRVLYVLLVICILAIILILTVFKHDVHPAYIAIPAVLGIVYVAWIIKYRSTTQSRPALSLRVERSQDDIKLDSLTKAIASMQQLVDEGRMKQEDVDNSSIHKQLEAHRDMMRLKPHRD